MKCGNISEIFSSKPQALILRRYRPYLLGVIMAVTAILCPVQNGAPARADQPLGKDVRDLLPRLFQPIPPSKGLDPGKVALGERLFHDPDLSADRTVACATCHDISAGGADGKRVSTGIGGRQTTRNSLTVLNTGLQQDFFWDGRARSLEEQIDGPINSKNEMAGDWPIIIQRLTAQPAYREPFKALYGGAISEAAIKDAIAQYEKSLNTPGSRFDKFLAGDNSALNEQEAHGLSYFVRLGCASCHQGTLLGANVFQRIGVYRARPGSNGQVDFGRYSITGLEDDRFVFKVPSLRNVALTAPYFHDGSIPDLRTAVQTMARLQLNKSLDERTTDQIVAFLQTLTGELPVRSKTFEARR
jgi:cytochrome c peroxidase